MGKRNIGVDPNRVFGLQKDYGVKAHIAMNKNDEQFFDCFEAFLKANPQQKKEFIEKVLVKGTIKEIFVVGEVFQHRNENLIPQYFGDNFRNWLWASAQTKLVIIDAFGKKNSKEYLKEYVLDKDMNNFAIQSTNKSTPMSEHKFWAMLFLLIINPKLGKKILKYELQKGKVYIFHIKLASGRVVAVDMNWNSGEWLFGAYFLGHEYPWKKSNIFLFLTDIN
jgi:hypothetical protein